jgi:hypothetical protein
MFWRRRVWDKVGSMNTEFHYAMDWDFMLRAEAAGFRMARGVFWLAPCPRRTKNDAELRARKGGNAEAASEITWACPEPT